MNPLWDWIRRKTEEAFLAGAHAAITGRGATPLSNEEAARALRGLLGSAGQAGDPPALPAPPQPSPTQPADDEPKRGPGRPPRKFQEPPQ
jgi:hypothetical protein